VNGNAFARKYGPWALVTGAAMGLGAAFAERLGSAGMDLILVDRAAEALAERAEGLRRRFVTVQVREAVADLADASEVERVLNDAADVEVGLLVACAAHAVTAPWLDITLEDKIRQIQVNCVSVTQMVDRLSRSMAGRGRGGIIVVSSAAGQIGTPLVATYAATKAFDLILAESLWAELRGSGVDVLGLMPGMTRTPGFEGSLGSVAKLPKGVEVMEPEEVVHEALDALGKGPSIVAGRRNRLANVMTQRLLSRKAAIELMARSMRSMYPGTKRS
jgi:short-subunit dehydrogenase